MSSDDTIEIHPLVPADWSFFCLDQIPYHGRSVTVLWDRTGEHYSKGKGLRILVNGKELASSPTCCRLKAKLP